MNDSTAMNTGLRVAKRDGTVEPFVIGKILKCVQNGLAASGEPLAIDTSAAGGLAEAVYEYLKSSYSDSPVPSSHLAELVELVLSQTGHSAAGMAIRQHAYFRERQRRRVMVATPRPGDGRFVQKRWDKTLLIQHLRRHHLLDTPASRMIAGRVEQMIFDCGLRSITGGLVREMARSEMLAWGLLAGALVVKKTRKNRGTRRVEDRFESA
jgi:hypothetical protein